MSSEWKDYQRDLRADFEYNFDVAIDGIPGGWMELFFPQLKDELFEACGAYADEIMFYQIKEKWNMLRIYWNFPDKDYYTDEDYKCIDELIVGINEVVNKYTEISKNIGIT